MRRRCVGDLLPLDTVLSQGLLVVVKNSSEGATRPDHV